MKKAIRCICVLLTFALLAGGAAYAEVTWETVVPTTSGGITLGGVCTSKSSLFPGEVFPEALGDLQGVQMWSFGAVDGNSYFYIACNVLNESYEALQNSTGSEEDFDVRVTDESGEEHLFYGHWRDQDTQVQFFDSEAAFDTIVEYGDRSRENCGEVLALLLTDQVLEFDVEARNGAWGVRFTADMAGFSDAYHTAFGDSATEEPAAGETADAETAEASQWTLGQYSDAFGDPIEGSYVITNVQHFEGTFSNTAAYNSPLWAEALMDEYGFSFWFYQYQNTDMLYRNVYSRYDETYTVSIKDENGDEHVFYGFMFVNDPYLRVVDDRSVYDRIYSLDDLNEDDYDEVLALFLQDQVLKVSIIAEEGADSFNFTVDTHGFAEAYASTISPLKEYTGKETVKSVQTALNAAGYECGTPDGIAGKNTGAAITEYQTDNGLTVTGTVTHELLISLGLIGG